MICGKTVYATKNLARRALRGFQKRQVKNRMHVYFCRACRGFHFGH